MLDKFFHKVRRKQKDFKYLWVIERGGEDGDGRLHYHLLTNYNFPNIKYANSWEFKSEEHKNVELCFRDKYWTYGFVDIRKLTNENSIRSVAGYVSAYITKSMMCLELVNQQISNHSRNVNLPIIDTYVSEDDIKDMISGNMYDLKYSNNYSYYGGAKVNYYSFDIKN